MNNRKWRGSRLILVAFAMLIAASVVALAVLKKVRQEAKQKPAPTTLKAERVSTPPEVLSKVKDLEVAGVTIVRQGTPEAAVAIDIINKSDQAVVSLELSAGDKDDFSDLGLDGLVDPLHPQVRIPAHSLKTFEWGLGEILKGYPVVVSAATFADGKEDGETRSIEMMHHDQARSRAQREAATKKEAPQ